MERYELANGKVYEISRWSDTCTVAHWDFSGMMQSAKEELRDTAPNVKIEKPLPEGQLSIFDLFNI